MVERPSGGKTVPGHDVVAIGASAGGIEALRCIVHGLPSNFPAAVFVVVHVSPDSGGALGRILSRSGSLPATLAHDGESIQNGRIYVAPPDAHLILRPGYLRLSHAPREHGFRPAVDPLFRSAAEAYGSRVVGVILSGGDADGVYGSLAIKACGGLIIVQDPADALFANMPRSVLEQLKVDHCLPAREIAATLIQLTSQPSPPFTQPTVEELPPLGTFGTLIDLSMIPVKERLGTLVGITCPNCEGVLWETKPYGMVEYCCRVGHVFSPISLWTEKGQTVESALWAAVDALEEQADLAHRLKEKLYSTASPARIQYYEQRARESLNAAALIRQLLMNGASSLTFEKLEGPSLDEDSP
jgi:two-component system chemotaxis response regulator CheB